MSFCSNCGQKLRDVAKFCDACGTPAGKQDGKHSKRTQEYVGKIIKCPACGEELPSMTAICPACGHEIVSSKVSDSIANFAAQVDECDLRIANAPEAPQKGWSTWGKGKRFWWVVLNIYLACIPLLVYYLRPLIRTDKAPALTNEEKSKASLIQNHQFPNDRGALLDALLFIKSKVATLSTEKNNANNAFWMRIWYKKAEDLFQKAEILFRGDSISNNTFNEIREYYQKMRKKQKIRVLATLGVIAVFAIFIFIRSGSGEVIKNYSSTIEIPSTELSDIMPQIEGGKGKIVTNNSYCFSVEYYGISDKDFDSYKKLCKDQGYTIDCQNDGSLFDAFNSEGYNIRVTYYSTEMHITISDAQEFRTIVWPDSSLANLLPIPKSEKGRIESSNEKDIIMYISETSIDDFNDYVDACIEKGFCQDMVRQDKHFHADDKDGHHVRIDYEGFNTMFIRIDK